MRTRGRNALRSQPPLKNARLERLGRSLAVKRQREMLDAIGVRAGTKVVYLKAAWADPVLCGGRGERFGTDIDVLIAPTSFEAFGRELEALGFRRDALLAHHAQRGSPFRAPRGLIDVDLHHALGQRPWFPLDDAGLLERAHPWESVDGPIMGLCAEDQVVHAVTHHAGDRFTLDDRHTTDIVRLLGRQSVAWDRVRATCAEAKLEIALHVFAGMLRKRGAAAPDFPLTRPQQLRLHALRRAFAIDGQRRFWTKSRKANIRLELVFLLPLLSTRTTALARFAAAAVRARLGGER